MMVFFSSFHICEIMRVEFAAVNENENLKLPHEAEQRVLQ